jgi:hypothetical protein
VTGIETGSTGFVGDNPDGLYKRTLDESELCTDLVKLDLLVYLVDIYARARARAMMRVRALDWVRGVVEF